MKEKRKKYVLEIKHERNEMSVYGLETLNNVINRGGYINRALFI